MKCWVETVGAASSLELIMDKILPFITGDILPQQVRYGGLGGGDSSLELITYMHTSNHSIEVLKYILTNIKPYWHRTRWVPVPLL
jgi:hypothetical protein